VVQELRSFVEASSLHRLLRRPSARFPAAAPSRLPCRRKQTFDDELAEGVSWRKLADRIGNSYSASLGGATPSSNMRECCTRPKSDGLGKAALQ